VKVRSLVLESSPFVQLAPDSVIVASALVALVTVNLPLTTWVASTIDQFDLVVETLRVA
jgi:hypothetical protein